MIGHLRGKPVAISPELVLIDVQGVGYAVHIPLSTYYEIERAGAGVEVGLFVHTHLREGELALFGFWTDREKLLFEKLISVGGIGPRLARVILSGLAADELISATAAGDLARLTGIPGVGKKTAERIVLELKDKVQELAVDLPDPAAPADADVVSALVNLGYKETTAENAVQRTRQEHPEAEFHELLRATLRKLSRA